ncbi:MAG: hypothetical protein KKD18_03345 [Nanoarchaeota archaeon]|nr:hypothetical protein [Nanoarchaeota archaeon]MBU0977425.1 hypothetical protein [Nanoarchaeota archaeon]
MVKPELKIKEDPQKIEILVRPLWKFYDFKIEKTKGKQEVIVKWWSSPLIPTKRVILEKMKEVIAAPMREDDPVFQKNRWLIILKFESFALLIGSVNRIDLINFDLSIKQRLGHNERLQNSLLKEDVLKLASTLGVRAKFLKKRPEDLSPA